MQVWGIATTPVLAQVFSTEFTSDPVSEGWELLNQYCDPELWNKQGWYHQRLDIEACLGSTQGGHDSYQRSLEPFSGVAAFFLEFRLQTDGSSSEIPAGAPAAVAMGNNAGVIYHVTVARDLVKFARDVDLPIWFVEIEIGVPHIFRIELYADRFAFYIDAYVIDEGVVEGPFPAYRSSISWRGKSWRVPCENAWDYIRYGVIPEDGSGDFDSDGSLTLFDHYFAGECLSNDRPGIHGGPGQDAGPGCRFADFDADGDTDLLDFAEFQNLFNGSHP